MIPLVWPDSTNRCLGVDPRLAKRTRNASGRFAMRTWVEKPSLLLVTAIVSISLAGCESPTLLMTAEGPSNEIPHNGSYGQYAILKATFTAAQSRALAIATTPTSAEAAYSPPSGDQ